MSVEREVKLVAPSGFELPELAGVVAGARIAPPSRYGLDATYYDCADLRLARAGVTLRYRTGAKCPQWTLKLPGETGAALVREEMDFAGSPEVIPEQARDLLRALVRTEPLVAVARLATERVAVEVTDSRGHETVEVVDDLVTVLDGTRPAGEFREVEVEEKGPGRNGLLDAVVARLVAAGCRADPQLPKLIRALGAPAQAPADVAVPALDAEATIQQLVQHAIAASVARIVRHDAGLRVGTDPEELHQFRVGARRLRSDLRTFAPLLERSWVDALRAELRWLGAEVGVVRDSDVLAERLRAQAVSLPPADADAFTVLSHRMTDQARQRRAGMLAAVRSARYDALLDALVDAAHRPRFVAAPRKSAARVAARLVRRPWRQLARAARGLPATPTDEELHRLRILAKRCRYAAEAVVPVAGRRARRFAAAMARIQTVLGDHQDTVVAEDWLRVAVTEQPESAMAAVELIIAQRAQRAGLRQQWPEVWAAASDKRLRSWL